MNSTYLNYRDGNSVAHRFPAPPKSPPIPSIPSRSSSRDRLRKQFSSALLILITDVPSPDMQTHLSTIFTRYAVTEVTILATSDETLKATRMDIYTAAGKMKQDILVSTEKLQVPISPSALKLATQGLETKTLCGVLLCEHAREPVTASDSARDILDYEDSELEQSWRTSILSLHTLARATIPILSRASSQNPPFFVIDSSIPLSSLDASTQDALIQSIASSPAAQGLKIGPASRELAPPPPPPQPEQVSSPNLSIDTNMKRKPVANGGWTPPERSPEEEESPTKLWASWALANE